MDLEMKWHSRQVVRALASLPFSLTALLGAWCIFQLFKFHEYGLGMFPGLNIPKNFDSTYPFRVLWYFRLGPVAPWFLATVPIDVLIRRFGYKLYD
jgi:hypothetical protein